MKLRRNPLTVGLSVVALVVFAACGSDGDESSDLQASPEPTAQPPVAPALPTPQPILDLDDAERALRDGHLEAAAEAFATFAGQSDDDEAAAGAHLRAGVAWRQAQDTGAAEDALHAAIERAPDGSSTERTARFLLAEHLAERGDVEAAAETMQPLVESPVNDALQPHVDARFASAAAEAGDMDAANGVWDRALASDEATASLRLAIYRERRAAARNEDDLDEAARWAKEAVELGGTAADRFRHGEIAVNRDDRETWEAEFRRILSDFPASAEAERVIEVFERAGETVDAGTESYVHYLRGRYEAAREVLEASLEAGDLNASEEVFQTFYLAASYEDDGYPAESIPLYDRVTELDPDSPYAHRAQYWAAKASEATGDVEGASERYAALVDGGKGGEFRDEALFRAGYVRLEGGDGGEAVAAWAGMEAEERDARTLYWEGHALELTGDVEAAEARFGAAAAAEPRAFHGLEAARRLGQMEPPSPEFREIAPPGEPDWDAIAQWETGEADATAPAAAETPADAFMRVGMERQARQVLDESDAPDLARLRAAATFGLASSAARIATQMLSRSGERADSAPQSLLQLAYPIAYVTLMGDMSRQYGIDPLFLAALIRVESFWDPGAVSPADAMGLTQVIPATGAGIADALGVAGWEPAQLFRPVVSLEFGAYYLAEQLAAFDDPYVALAAYNGGPGNAARWHKATGGGTPAELVERITFAETTSYVQRVMSTYAHYELAYRPME